MNSLKKILFVCVENAARSQIAEGFFNKFAPAGFESISAGTKPVGEINPLAFQVMKGVGIDIGNHWPKLISDDAISSAYKIVNMGYMDKEECPSTFVKDLLEWNIEDPKGKSVESVRKIRDQIEVKVRDFADSL